MKRDKITISENTVIVTGGNIWMTEAEIVELFGTTAGAVQIGRASCRERVSSPV